MVVNCVLYRYSTQKTPAWQVAYTRGVLRGSRAEIVMSTSNLRRAAALLTIALGCTAVTIVRGADTDLSSLQQRV